MFKPGGEVQVWDVVGGSCVQTIEKAHKSVIMGLIQWQVRPPCHGAGTSNYLRQCLRRHVSVSAWDKMPLSRGDRG